MQKLDIYSNELSTITKINKEFVFIQDESDKQIEIPIDKFQKFFYVAYCITTHKSQAQLLNLHIPYTNTKNLIVD